MAEKSNCPISPDGALSMILEIGDALAADWQVTLMSDGVRQRRWEGNTTDKLPDTVELPAGAVAPGDELAWAVLLYGPSQPRPYHVRVKIQQGGRDLCEPPVRLSGELKARKTETLSGVITLTRKTP